MCTLESYIKLELSGIRGVALGVMQSEPSVTAAVSDLYSWMAGSSYFFFFQAEDGIRDHCVTGVQTCALPIYDHARFLEVVVTSGARAVRIASIYLPNGNPPDTDKYIYKLGWMDRLLHYAEARLRLEEPLVLAGDYNVIPAPADVHDPAVWAGDALFLPHTRAKFRALVHLGLTEAVPATTDAEGIYTFWDYQAGAWQKNAGIRIDHLLLSPQAADHLTAVGIDKHARGWEKPSDHVPVWIELDL